MEAASNAASTVYNTASKLIYGEAQSTESGQEPISGEQGEGSKTAPFDQGNQGEIPPSSIETKTQLPSAPVTSSSSTGGSDTKIELPSAPVTSSSTVGGSDINKELPSAPVTSSSTFGGSENVPSGAGLTEAQQPLAEHQGAGRPLDEPTGQQVGAIQGQKDAGEAALSARDPNAGPTSQDSLGGGLSGDKSTTGTGITSTGLAADGGNFDATKPGAGSEASRLRNSEGVTSSTGPSEDLSTGDSSGGKEKTSVKDKIKEKLHIGHKS